MGPGATTTKLPCQLAEQPSSTARQDLPASNECLRPLSPAQIGGAAAVQQGGALPVLLPACTAILLHHSPTSWWPQGWSYGWRNPSLQHHGDGRLQEPRLPRDGARSRQDRLSVPQQRHSSPGYQVGQSTCCRSSPPLRSPRSSPAPRQHQQQGRCWSPQQQMLGWTESEGQLHLQY